MDYFEMTIPELLYGINATYYLCLTDPNQVLSGSLTSLDYNTLTFVVQRCSTRPDCKSDEEIDALLNSDDFYFILGFQTYYIDSNDYDAPIKPILNADTMIKVTPGMRKNNRVYVSRNTFLDNPNVFGYGDTQEYTYYNLATLLTDYEFEKSTERILMATQVVLDDKEVVRERNVYTLFDMIANIGGFFELIFRGSFLIVAVFSNKSYLSYLFYKLYKVQKHTSKIKPTNEHRATMATHTPTQHQPSGLYKSGSEINLS